MKNKPEYYALIEAQKLTLSSPEYVFDWLEKHVDDDSLPSEIFETLYNCNNELIKLGLARFCSDKETLRRLFNSALDKEGEAIRCSVLSNKNCTFGSVVGIDTFNAEELKVILEKATSAEISAIMENESFKGYYLADIFNRTRIAENLTDDQWFLCCIRALYLNPNIRRDYQSKSGYTDFWAAAAHSAAIKAAWQLLEIVPLTFNWAANLCSIFGDYPRILLSDHCNEDFFKRVFIRWKSDDSALDGAFGELRMWIGTYVPGSFQVHEWMANNEDKHIRLGHYSSFNTNDPEELEKYYARDSKDFIQMAIGNDWLYRDKKIRNKLRELIGKTDSDGMEIWTFSMRLERLREKEPTKYLSEEEWKWNQMSQPVTNGILEEKLEKIESRLMEQIEQLGEQLEEREKWSKRALTEHLEEVKNKLMEHLDQRVSNLKRTIF